MWAMFGMHGWYMSFQELTTIFMEIDLTPVCSIWVIAQVYMSLQILCQHELLWVMHATCLSLSVKLMHEGD